MPIGTLKKLAGAVCVLWLGLEPPVCSSALPDRQPTDTPPARTVILDAVVTDGTGSPLLKLSPDDFEIVEEGVVQRLESLEARVIDPASNGNGGSPAVIESEEDETRAAREPGTRVLGLLLDEFHVSAESTAAVRAALTAFVDQLRPRDLLVVLKPLDPLDTIRFTRDRAEARRAIETFTGRKGDYTGLTAFEQTYLGSAPAALQAGRANIVMAALRALTMKMGELQAGRSALVFVSEGFALEQVESGRSGSARNPERRVAALQGIVRAASRFHVSVYPVDPAGASAVDDPATGALRVLATQTGGEAVTGAAGLTAGLRRVSRDLDAYYLLHYTSSHPRDGRFYDVEIRVKRRGAHVRARSGYWAPLRSELLEARSSGATARARRVIRRSPLIHTWLGLTVDREGRQRMVFTWELADTPAARAPHPAVVALTVSTERGDSLYEGEIAPAGVRSAGLAEADRAVFDVSPGRIQLDLRILGLDGAQIDTGGSDVEVPDVRRADPLILPPQVFRAASAREFNGISTDPSAAPTPAREFRRTARLLVRAPTYSASGARIQLAVRVMNRRGQVLRELLPMATSSADAIPQFDLPLSWLAPGEYTIDLTASTPSNTAREIVRFKITR